MVPERAREEPARPSGCEPRIRRRLAALILLLACVAVLRNLGALAFAPFSLLTVLGTGLYLYSNTRYHRAFSVFLVVLGLAVYAFPPVFQPFTPMFALKGFVLTADWRGEGVGPQDPWSWLALYLMNVMVFGAGLFLLVTGVSSRVRAGNCRRCRQDPDGPEDRHPTTGPPQAAARAAGGFTGRAHHLLTRSTVGRDPGQAGE